jgi:hypothetical protein
MEDLTFDNDEEKCQGKAQQPHARTPTSHLRGCSRVGLRSSSHPSSDLGSVFRNRPSKFRFHHYYYIYCPLGFVWVGLYLYTARPTLQLWPDLCSSHLASHLLAQPLTSCFFYSKHGGLCSQSFKGPLQPPILSRPLSFSARTFTLHCLDLCPLVSTQLASLTVLGYSHSRLSSMGQFSFVS